MKTTEKEFSPKIIKKIRSHIPYDSELISYKWTHEKRENPNDYFVNVRIVYKDHGEMKTALISGAPGLQSMED